MYRPQKETNPFGCVKELLRNLESLAFRYFVVTPFFLSPVFEWNKLFGGFGIVSLSVHRRHSRPYKGTVRSLSSHKAVVAITDSPLHSKTLTKFRPWKAHPFKMILGKERVSSCVQVPLVMAAPATGCGGAQRPTFLSSPTKQMIAINASFVCVKQVFDHEEEKLIQIITI